MKYGFKLVIQFRHDYDKNYSDSDHQPPSVNCLSAHCSAAESTGRSFLNATKWNKSGRTSEIITSTHERSTCGQKLGGRERANKITVVYLTVILKL